MRGRPSCEDSGTHRYLLQDSEKGNAAKRMAEIHETLEKLVAVAKKKGYIDQDCTVQSLKEEAAHKKSEEEQGDAVSLMTAMKKSLDTQTHAVRFHPDLQLARCTSLLSPRAIGIALKLHNHLFSCVR
jgi:uncharacterized protein YbcC (UPF0753/DUF2309 family)